MPKDVTFRKVSPGEQPQEPAPLTAEQFQAAQATIQLAMARSRVAIAGEQARLSQMEADFCELVLKFRTQPQKS